MTQNRLPPPPPSAANPRVSARIWIYLIILLGTALRFFQLGHFSLWDGEIFTLFISQKPLPLILPALRDFGAHPPLWFFITRAFDAFGWNEWMLRAPAALVGILAIPAMYVLGKRAANVTVGLLAALLFACAPLAVLYAQVGRMYSVMFPLTALILYAMLRAAQTTFEPPRVVLSQKTSMLSMWRHRRPSCFDCNTKRTVCGGIPCIIWIGPCCC